MGGGEAVERLASIDPSSAAATAKERVIGQDELVDSLCRELKLAITARLMQLSGIEADDLPEGGAVTVVATTGSGKSFAIRQVAKAMGVRSSFVDCSQLTGAGWAGLDVGDALADAAGLLSEGEPCVLVVWDEVDKLISTQGSQDPSFSPQKNLLKVLDGGQVATSCGGTSKPGPAVDGARLVHVFAGAFTGIEEVVGRRLFGSGAVGFTGTVAGGASRESLRSLVGPGDLEAWGVSKELVGRMGRIVSAPSLSVDSLRAIAKGAPHSVESRYDALARGLGVAFSIDGDACEALAEMAHDSGLGARAIWRFASAPAAEAIDRAVREGAAEARLVIGRDGSISHSVRGRRSPSPTPGWVEAAANASSTAAPGKGFEAYGDAGKFGMGKTVCAAIDNAIGPQADIGSVESSATLGAIAAALSRFDPPGTPHLDFHVRRCAEGELAAVLKYIAVRGDARRSVGSASELLGVLACPDGADRFEAMVADARDECLGGSELEQAKWFDDLLAELEGVRRTGAETRVAAAEHARAVLVYAVHDADHARDVGEALGRAKARG